MSLEGKSVKELKVIATEAGIEFKKNASTATMLELLAAYSEGVSDVAAEEVVAEAIVEKAVEVEDRKKVFGGICLKTGKELYL